MKKPLEKPLHKQTLPATENTGKCYIDPESTQIFIASLVKAQQESTASETKNTELLDMVE